MAEVEIIQKICLSLKGVTEDIKWSNVLVFSVKEKMFCLVGLEPPFRCSFKVKDEEFEELSTLEGFMAAPYLARAKWVSVSDVNRLRKKEWESHIRQSYQLVASKLPKKTREELGI